MKFLNEKIFCKKRKIKINKLPERKKGVKNNKKNNGCLFNRMMNLLCLNAQKG